MKLKSCFLITLMACAFFSCSDNDDPVNPMITPVVPDATLSLAVQTDNRVKTKGGFIDDDHDGATTSWDFEVKTLTAVVFNNGAYNDNNIAVGTIAALFTQNYENPTNTTVIEGEVMSGNVNLLLIANLDAGVLSKLTASVNSPVSSNRLTVVDVLKLATPLSSETKENGLTMSSEVLSVELVAGTNFVGFGEKGTTIVNEYGTGTEIYGEKPVELTRTVAAIKLKGVLLPETPDAAKPEYKNVSFRLDSVFVANVKSTAGIGTYSVDNVTTIEQSPLTTEGALNPEYYLAPLKYASSVGTYKTGGAIGDDSMLRVLSTAQIITAKSGTNVSTTDLDWTNTSVPPCYVYPNQNGETGVDGKQNYTLLVLRGTYTYKIGDNEVTEENRYYTVIVNDNSQGGTISGDEVKKNVHIQRNTKYDVTVQILGSGSDDPFTPAAFAHVAAQVKVADWNVIEIDEDVD